MEAPSGGGDQGCRAGQMLGSGIGSNFQVWADRYRPATLDDVRARLFRLIDSTPDLDWLLLTKRPENVRRMWTCPQDPHVTGGCYHSQFRDNVWLGTSIACQADADRNVPELLKCRDLCAKTSLSIEPLVGSVDLSRWLNCKCRTDGWRCDSCVFGPLDWVIVGGESGPNARPCNVAWIRSIVRQCRDAGVPCFVKQLGRVVVADAAERSSWAAWGDHGPWMRDIEGPKLRDPKGGDMAEWPEDLRVREVPT